jgi:hypothetical protein
MKRVTISVKTSDKTIAEKYPVIATIINSGSEVKYIKKDLPLPEHTYYFSCIDSKDKYSKGYQYCVCLIISGLEIETNIPVSFLGHITKLVSTYGSEKFSNSLKKILIEFKSKAKNETIEATICSGCYLNDKEKIDYDNIVTQATSILEENNIKYKILDPKKESHISNNIFIKTDEQIFYDLRRYC